jgi:hypothetical protein
MSVEQKQPARPAQGKPEIAQRLGIARPLRSIAVSMKVLSLF